MNKDYFQIIFASIFFVTPGMVADFHTLTREIVVFLSVLTIVTIVSGHTYRSLFQRYIIVGIGMARRREVAMIVALIVHEDGIIKQESMSFGLMSLLTTLITPIVFRNWFYRGEYCGYDASGARIEGEK